MSSTEGKIRNTIPLCTNVSCNEKSLLYPLDYDYSTMEYKIKYSTGKSRFVFTIQENSNFQVIFD